MSKKLSASTITAIKSALYGCANTTSAWAGEMSYFKHLKATDCQITEYGYRGYMLDEVRTAQLIEGKRLHGTAVAVYPVTLVEFMQAIQTSILHHQSMRTNTYSLSVSRLEMKMIELLRPISQYVDIHLGETTDKFYGCRRRDVVITVKPEYRNSVSLSVKHTLLDKNLSETACSYKERNYRETFTG